MKIEIGRLNPGDKFKFIDGPPGTWKVGVGGAVHEDGPVAVVPCPYILGFNVAYIEGNLKVDKRVK